MKSKYLIFFLILTLYSCNKEWQSELFVKDVSFVNNGLKPVYAKYKSAGGTVTLKVPIILSGSTNNNVDVQVSLGLDKDTLTNLNFERFRYRQDLHFVELPSSNYSFESTTTTIPKGSNYGFYNLNLKMEDLDMFYKYLLPLELVSTSAYEVSPRRWYKKAMMQIIPFNDYSGRYSSSGRVERVNSNDPALTIPTRTTWVVDENTVFFYAGVIEEEAYDRAKYRINARFNADGSITLSAADPTINFSQISGSYTVEKVMDDVQPYLERTITTMNLEYRYNDITNPLYPLEYKFSGALVLDRKRNTQIPEEDQQVVIDSDLF